MNKVAAITLSFWVMKICATTLGETAGDLLSLTLNIGYAASTVVLLGLFLLTLVWQVRSVCFHPGLYWLVILSTSMAGTTMSDFMDRTLNLGYAAGSAWIASTLVLVLMVWRVVEGSLSVALIQHRRTELFYWVAVLVSNTLGTALGDFLADNSGLGFSGGALLIGGSIAVVSLLYYVTRLNRVALFWVAFVLTRPFGATFGDWLTKPVDHGGLGFGTIGSSAVLAAILLVLVVRSVSVWNRQPNLLSATSNV